MKWFKSLHRKAMNLICLSQQERLLLVQAFILLPTIAFSLQIWGMQRTQTVLFNLSAKTLLSMPSSSEVQDQIKQTAFIVEKAAHYSRLWSNCLRKSLVLWFLLRRRGVISELRIGVRRENATFQAHAWVEYQGIVLNDMPNVREQFVMFESSIGEIS